MRTFLHKIMVDITRHPREIIQPVWSNKLWVHNIFRVYEYLFGRRAGPRLETSGTVDKDGKQYVYFFTTEAVLAHMEGMVRKLFKLKLPSFEVVRLPVLITPTGEQFALPYSFAIAYVTANTGTLAASITISLTASGSNLYAFGSPIGVSSAGGTDPMTTSTYAGVNMSNNTSTNIKGSGTNAIWMRVDYLASPTTGTQNYVCNQSGGQFLYGASAGVWSGVDQGVPDATGVGFTWPSAPPSGVQTLTLNTATANCWVNIFGFGESGGPYGAGTNTTIRVNPNQAVGDSNGTVATGSISLSMNNFGSSGTSGVVGAKFAQVAVATVNSGMFLVF